jgi:hypothetical protein
MSVKCESRPTLLICLTIDAKNGLQFALLTIFEMKWRLQTAVIYMRSYKNCTRKYVKFFFGSGDSKLGFPDLL